MKIEGFDKQFLFSETSLPDVFFTEYLPQFTNGDYLKIYLYLYFFAKYDKDIKINDLSKRLELPLKTLQDGIKDLEDKGLLIRKNQGYEITNLQEIELNKIYKPKVTMSSEDLAKAEQNKHRISAIEAINNECFSGVMSPSWYTDINLWFKKYEFDEEVMIALFRYCFNKSALHRSYITTVAEAWHKNKIKTFQDLDAYYGKQEKLQILAKEICKRLRIRRELTTYELAYIEKWNISYNYNIDIIDIALRKTVSKNIINFEYVDKIITDWKDHSLKTVDEVNEYLNSKKESYKANTKTKKETNNKGNFTSRSYDDLNKFYSNGEEE